MDTLDLNRLREIADSDAMIPLLSRRVLVELLAVYDAADTLCRTPLGDGEAQARLNLEAIVAVVRP